MKKIIRHLPGLVLLALLVTGIVVFNAFNTQVQHFRLVRHGFIEDKTYPVKENFGNGEVFSVEFDMVSRFQSVSMRIIPDDCVDSVFVDGRPKSLAGVQGLCSYSKGFDFSAEPGHYQFFLHNGGGPGGFDLMLKRNVVQDVLYVVNTLLLLALLGTVLYRFKVLPLHLMLMLLVAVGLHSAYTSGTNYMTRSYDCEGHVAYVKFIAEKGSIPKDRDCWSCYHPPVYYALNAPVWIAAEKCNLFPPRALQWVSFGFSIMVLVLGAKILSLLLSGGALTLSCLLWFFWPVLFMTAPRLGNDQLFFLAHVLCLFAAVKYIVEHQGRYLVLALLMVALAFWTKSTGVVTALVFCSAFVLGYFPRQALKPTKSEAVSLAVFAVFAVCVALVKLLGDSSLVGNLNSLNSSIRVGSATPNLLYFDLKEFLTVPYTSSWSDGGGRQYMMNFLAKTSMFGEATLNNSLTGRNLATVMSFLFLVLAVVAVVGFVKTRIGKLHVLLLLQVAFFLAAMIYLRVKAPFACSSDFRYIVPVLLSVIPFVGFGVFKDDASLKWKCLGVGSVILFVLCSIWLMTTL